MAIPRTAGDGLGQYTTPAMIATFLPTVSISKIFLILEQLQSVISSGDPDEPINFWHASISDFLLDEVRSEDFFVDTRVAHEAIARGYLRLFQGQGPGLFLDSNPDFFLSFLEHYKRATLSKRLQQDLVAYDLFSAYKAGVGEPMSLLKLLYIWESERVPKLFRTLV
jgi:hypothetical protein